MVSDFYDWLFRFRYPLNDSLKTLNILKNKYLNADQNIKYIHITRN